MRLAILADVHGNRLALERVIADAVRRAAENGRQDWAFALTTGFAQPATESLA